MVTTITIIAVYLAMRIGHDTGDHPVQTGWQAANKGHDWRALLGHVGTYTVCTSALVLLAGLLPDVEYSPLGFVLGQVFSAATHVVIDRRPWFATAMSVIGKAEFYRLGAPRPGRDDNPSLGTGAYALDQWAHRVCLAAASVITATI
ncbi:DUF3307 domain-containing protein [Saccharopolyspora taberi]|uniref:DUF3307 domain-containing protein n=1 Tax=Saccharopolyspora taberi TaxID=60895 RepID=A0ABN3V0H5_9PSEU